MAGLKSLPNPNATDDTQRSRPQCCRCATLIAARRLHDETPWRHWTRWCGPTFCKHHQTPTRRPRAAKDLTTQRLQSLGLVQQTRSQIAALQAGAQSHLHNTRPPPHAPHPNLQRLGLPQHLRQPAAPRPATPIADVALNLSPDSSPTASDLGFFAALDACATPPIDNHQGGDL